MKTVFWISAGIVIYSFLIYPCILVLLSGFRQFLSDLRFAKQRGDRRTSAPFEYPYVTMIIPAHNEGAVIADKMENCREIRYPAGRLEILVGCDGCTDDTVQQVRSVSLPNVTVFPYNERSGKPALLNRLVHHASGEILLFSDANTFYARDAVLSMVKRFANPEVGAVCGELKLMSHDGSPKPEGSYWRYECFLKILESRLNMLVGANGAIFAMRRALYRPLPPRTINDDFLIAMRVRAEGNRVVYDPEACAFEETAPLRQEFRRRVRIGSGDLRALKQTWRMLSPTAGLIALSYWSHKVFRWMVPFALVTCFVSAVASAREPFYLGCLLLGLVFALSGLMGYVFEDRPGRLRAFDIPCHFLAMNLALMVGFLKDIFASRSSVWAPTQRVPRMTVKSAVTEKPEKGYRDRRVGTSPRAALHFTAGFQEETYGTPFRSLFRLLTGVTAFRAR